MLWIIMSDISCTRVKFRPRWKDMHRRQSTVRSRTSGQSLRTRIIVLLCHKIGLQSSVRYASVEPNLRRVDAHFPSTWKPLSLFLSSFSAGETDGLWGNHARSVPGEYIYIYMYILQYAEKETSIIPNCTSPFFSTRIPMELRYRDGKEGENEYTKVRARILL